MVHEIPLKSCAVEDCEETYRPHMWGSIKAHDRGWFLQKDGTAWCPQHVPEWVAEWREREAKKKA